MLQRVINIISVKVSEQGIDFEMEKRPGSPCLLFVNSGRIEQILINTINNAVKFTEKGLVLLSVRNVEKTENLYTIEFSVKDTGIGMSGRNRERTCLFRLTRAIRASGRRYAEQGSAFRSLKTRGTDERRN